jgi:hypothetical protein
MDSVVEFSQLGFGLWSHRVLIGMAYTKMSQVTLDQDEPGL